MIQTLDLPVLSLAIPNIHKINDINADNLSCMWTVFSKCKDNLENGRRLENMSWRLWYRESSLKESKTQPLSSTCPIPIQHTNNVIEHKSTVDKHLSPAFFKRIISSVNENEVILPPPSLKNTSNKDTPNLIMLQQPQFFTEKQDIESEDDEEGWSSDDEEEPTPKNNTTVVLPIKNNKKFTISDDEDSDMEEDEDNYQDTKDNNDLDETAFLSEFRKRTPPPIAHVITKGCSILSNMLRAQDSTRLANQPINVVQNQIQKHYIEGEELSSSMKKCVEWEHYQHDFIKLSQQHARMDSHNTFDSNYRSCW